MGYVKLWLVLLKRKQQVCRKIPANYKYGSKYFRPIKIKIKPFMHYIKTQVAYSQANQAYQCKFFKLGGHRGLVSAFKRPQAV